MPFHVQLDVFSPEIVINFTEAHIKLITKLMGTFQSYSFDEHKPDKTETTDINLEPEVYDELLENRTNEGWADWMKTWIYNTCDITTIENQTLKIGLYINSFQIIPKIETGKVLRSYKPLIKISFNGLMAEINKIDSGSLLDIKFGVSKTTIDSESDCTCTLQDCYNKPHVLSGKELNEYLAHSLFKRVGGIENIVYSLDEDFKDNSILKRTPSFGFDYVYREK
ncbi:uncharacterized protein LOC126834869 [Adelges cooleyi]|uniref:uncharacterized protein LOC126834869 n=1 Tax=Adelges cooleyi TaxID=133065 RepID=UPI00217F3A73|nr:uncharacterized protein LOC126834869 [Adelges cooleyi]